MTTRPTRRAITRYAQSMHLIVSCRSSITFADLYGSIRKFDKSNQVLKPVCTGCFCKKIYSVISRLNRKKLNISLLHLLAHIVPVQFNVPCSTTECRIHRQCHRARVVHSDLHCDALVLHSKRFFNDVVKERCFHTCLTRCYILRFAVLIARRSEAVRAMTRRSLK